MLNRRCLLILIILIVMLPMPVARAASSRWTWPLSAHSVSRVFAPPSARWGAGHRGVDLIGSAGETVFAAGAGTVTFAGRVAGRGVISIAHNTGLRTTYEPVTASVTVGMTVETGAPIGILETGHAGCPVPACVHWGLKREEMYLDPLSLFRRRQIRLLPLRDSPS
ncbi:MAG: M23 family metallopeptidase [Antricoccus sp.]